MALPDFDQPASPIAHQIRETVRKLLEGGRASEAGKAEAPASVSSPQSSQGLNDNLEFLGRRLHVQTEDLGRSARLITTQVFLNGRVIRSMKTPYPGPPGDAGLSERIAELMRAQHLSIISEIQSRRGRFEPA
jgi:hypothetical protein